MYQVVNAIQKNGSIKIIDPISSYNPNKAVKEVTSRVIRDMQTGRRNLTTPFTEFNDRSVIDEINQNQRNFNSYVPPRSEDPEDAWRAQTVRPVTRNKLISIAAHVTAQILYPNAFAQNKNDEEDRDAALVMRDLIEWVIDNSNYSRKFLQAVIAALTDPVTVMKQEYCEVMRQVKEMQDDGSYTMKEIIDTILSGFVFNLVQANEFYIANVYEPDLQKQRFVATRKLIDYEEARLRYGKHSNWKYVRPGVRTVFDDTTRTFYDQHDEDLRDYLVEEVVYENRADDLKITFISGIIMCDPDYANPRKDKMYGYSKTGYEFLNNGQFFYYKSAANKLASDQDLIDTMYNMVMDGTFLSLMPPMALYGTEEVNSSVTVPGMVTSFKDPNTKLENIGPRSDIRAGLESIALIEKSMSESSQDNMRQGMAESGERTAYEVSQLEKNARIALGLFGKMIGFFVEDIGNLLVGDIIQHLTVADMAEVTSPGQRMKFKSFLLPDKIDGGKKITKKIKFTDEYYGQENLSKEQFLDNSFKIMDEEGGFDSNTKIYKVNPELFRELKFKIVIAPDLLEPKNKNLEKALNLEAYDRLIQNPILDQGAVTRDFLLEVYKPGESDKYMKQAQPIPGAQGMDGGKAVAANTPNKQKGVNTNMVSQITGNNSLGNMK